MTWKDILKQQGFTVKTTPPLSGYSPQVFGEKEVGLQQGGRRGPITSSGKAEAFYHLKDFVIEKNLTMQATEFGTGPTADIPMKGTIGQMAQQRGEPDTKVAEFEIVPA